MLEHKRQGSMKQLRREIDRRLDYVNYVTHEPQVSLKALLIMNDESITLYSSYSFSLNNIGWKYKFYISAEKTWMSGWSPQSQIAAVG